MVNHMGLNKPSLRAMPLAGRSIKTSVQGMTRTPLRLADQTPKKLIATKVSGWDHRLFAFVCSVFLSSRSYI